MVARPAQLHRMSPDPSSQPPSEGREPDQSQRQVCNIFRTLIEALDSVDHVRRYAADSFPLRRDVFDAFKNRRQFHTDEYDKNNSWVAGFPSKRL